MMTNSLGRHFSKALASCTAGGLVVWSTLGWGGLATTSPHAHPAHHGVLSQQTLPQGRNWDSWAYDPAQRDIVLFGGNRGTGPWPAGRVLGDTWTWKAGCWTRQDPATSPAPRQGAAMAWDPATHQLLLFGGGSDSANPQFFGDTWTWNGTTWTQLYPATSPPPRHQADMVYDAAMHEIILFGGHGTDAYLNDTWAWNGTTWTQLQPATSPSPRDTDSLVYDPATKTAILYGGYNNGRLGDTWSWNGTTWTQLNPAQSPGVVSPVWQAAYDPARGQPLLYGGDLSLAGPYSQATWAWNGTTWVRLHPVLSAGPRGYGAMTYDPATKRVVLFGGNNGTLNPHSVWQWTGTTWWPSICR
jgi:hypothetical protein